MQTLFAAMLAVDGAAIASLVISIVGVVVTIAGFTVTLIQLRRTRKAADAAATAARLAESRFATNHLLILLPQLERVENDLSEACKADQTDIAMVHLSTWRWQAGQLHALLARTTPTERVFMKALQESVTLAADGKKVLLEKGGPVMKATRQARDGIASVTNRLGELTIRLSSTTEGDGDASPAA